jgi:hypothetical protein
MDVATKVLSLVSVFGLVAVPPSLEVSTNRQRHTMPGRVAAQSVLAHPPGGEKPWTGFVGVVLVGITLFSASLACAA